MIPDDYQFEIDSLQDALAECRALVAAVDKFLALPNWQHRCGEWKDVNTALENIEEARRLTPATSAGTLVDAAELSQLRRDRERLDWLLIFIGSKKSGLKFERAIAQNWSTGAGKTELENMRAAIDASRDGKAAS
jgi:hypothetical protein